MSTIATDKKTQLIDRLVRTLEERLPRQTGATAASFTRQYYQHVPAEDLLEEDWEDLYGAALSHFNFLRQRPPHTPLVRVFNPGIEEHGWQSTHTVVEIVTDDMPFLVDSISMELNRNGLTLHRIFHPVLAVERDGAGQLTGIHPLRQDGENIHHEAVMHFEVDSRTDPGVLAALEDDIRRILQDVRSAVEDWQTMLERLQTVTADLNADVLPAPEQEVSETREFLGWVADNHFTLLGYRVYDLIEEESRLVLQARSGTGLGILRDQQQHQAARNTVSILPDRQRQIALSPTLLVLTKANTRSTVHRPAHLDYISVKRFDEAGRVIGEHRFLGLYTSLAYSINPRYIPLLRDKIHRVMERASLPKISHTGKALQHILDTFPRDELFQATVAELYEISMGILHLEERQRLTLLVRQDAFERFMSCFVYVPRERYNTELRMRMQQILLAAFNGVSSEFVVQFSETVLARVLITVYTQPGEIPEYSVAEIETRLREAMQSWEDRLSLEMLDQVGEESGNRLFNLYGNAFPAGYREDFSARTGVRDIIRLERLGDDNPLEMHLYRPLEDPEGRLSFKVFGRNQAMPLSEALPILERLGLSVLAARPYELELSDGRRLWILDFDLREEPGVTVEVAAIREHFQEAFARIWAGQMENDGFNRLVVAAALPWRDITLLRAYCKYLLQTRVPFSQPYMEQAVGNHPGISALLVQLFHARFDPRGQQDAGRRTTELGVAIEEALDQVSNLDEDRILRRFLAVIQATLRTNFYQDDDQGRSKDYLSFKFDPARIPEMPLPLPMFEIFVYSPRTEAVHLRGGPVARGGLRWSDRREDFRTEVLGLMKAQMVKNAVIVPVGSKGGFVVKRPPVTGGREALQQEAQACYTIFMSGMLDITDNLVGGQVVPPRQVVRYDDDDPYLVVAADKGTATFSDLANSIAVRYGFWLGDAFASGGSAGYDHKKMGITARGAWESVKRHFRELGKDIQNEDFTVVGIGDMGGDVFGNGMLLSRHIRLLAAFNHLHIFIDPDPDAESSYRERERMFRLPRSTWEDYDQSLISQGGGIYSRSAKSIQLSPRAREVLGIGSERLTPNELVHNLLKAPVELLWNGGIGTYVKAVSETHTDVGDRANDAVRVNGVDLRCQVVGEGGNLGFTQLGRIEFARRGGHIYTDAIDNSGGVDSSDHEVNLKILLNQVVDRGDMTVKQRNELLAEMTDQVAELVLRHNYLQTQAISATVSRAPQMLGEHVRVIRRLERMGKLNREIEYLPSDEQLAEREAAHEGLTRPELAVLLAYSKIVLFEALVNSDVPDDPYLQQELVHYFPTRLSPQYREVMETHRLRKEIIATYITNSMLNRMGSVFTLKLQEAGETAPDIARAYAAARETYRARQLWSAIEALDCQVAASVQIDMNFASRHLIERATLWLLRNRRPPLDISAVVEQFGEGIRTLAGSLGDLLTGTEAMVLQTQARQLVEAGVPEDLARWVASLDNLYPGLDIVEVAAGAEELGVQEVAIIYFGLVDRLRLSWLRSSIAGLSAVNHWQNQARAALLNNLYEQQRALTAAVIRHTSAQQTPQQRLESWLADNRGGVERTLALFTDLEGSGQPDLAMLSVALRETGALVQGA